MFLKDYCFQHSNQFFKVFLIFFIRAFCSHFLTDAFTKLVFLTYLNVWFFTLCCLKIIFKFNFIRAFCSNLLNDAFTKLVYLTYLNVYFLLYIV
ncbi:unnamed protein product [Meloidogyne enterolobii]|uniref:Uncharacterized protein n=1 Tax=Meloidogyne enterolobii TaxID=390850 RepID=A0ACB0ZVX2_MELEN